MAEFLQFGKKYAAQTVENAHTLAEALSGEGFDVIGAKNGFTKSHQVLVRTSSMMPGPKAAKMLASANILTNKMPLEKADGLRIGVAESTRVGMRESEMKEIARLIGDVLIRRKDPERTGRKVRRFTKEFRGIRFSFEDGADAYTNARRGSSKTK